MRILHVAHAFPPFSRAGSENYAEALASEQARRHDVVVLHRIADPESPEYQLTEASVGRIPVVRLNRTFADLGSFEETYRSESAAAAFGHYLNRARPDVVHFHHTTCLSTTCVHEAHRRGIRVVYTLHDFWLLCPRGQLLRRDLSLCDRHADADCVRCMAYQLPIVGGETRVQALDRREARLRRLRLPADLHRRIASRPYARELAALREIQQRTGHVLEMCSLVDRFVSPSEFLKDRFVRFGIPDQKITVCDYGFDGSRWSQHAPVSRRPADPLRVAYLGTWIPSKGVHVLIEAFQGLEPQRATLDVHGYAVPYDGVADYEGRLRALADGAPHIRLRGRYEPEDVPRLLSEADVLVVPSIWYENSPLTIHEAFLAGVAVVTSAHGGASELVHHGENGLTFDPGSPRALLATLRRLLDEPGLLERLRSNSSPVTEIGEHARELEGLYQQLASASGASEGSARARCSSGA